MLLEDSICSLGNIGGKLSKGVIPSSSDWSSRPFISTGLPPLGLRYFSCSKSGWANRVEGGGLWIGNYSCSCCPVAYMRQYSIGRGRGELPVLQYLAHFHLERRGSESKTKWMDEQWDGRWAECCRVSVPVHHLSQFATWNVPHVENSTTRSVELYNYYYFTAKHIYCWGKIYRVCI